MRRKTIVDDMLATLMDDIDALSSKVPAFAAVGEKIREVVGPVDRKAKRLTAAEREKLSATEVAAGARGAFGRAVQRLNAEDKERRAKKKRTAAAPATTKKAKRRRSIGPEE